MRLLRGFAVAGFLCVLVFSINACRREKSDEGVQTPPAASLPASPPTSVPATVPAVSTAPATIVLPIIQPPRLTTGRGRMPKDVNFTATAVDKAIEKGAAWLWTKQEAHGGWGSYRGQGMGPNELGNSYAVGPTALAIYALLQTDGKLAQDARIMKAFDWFEKLPPVQPFKLGTVKTYELGLMANAYQSANCTTKQKYAKQLDLIANHLIWSTADGSYGYDSTYEVDAAGKLTGQSSGDNSNSSYGVLGVGAWVRDGKSEVPMEYWEKLMTHWLTSQHTDGGWGYTSDAESTGTMTAAGIANLYLCADGLLSDAYIKCNAGEKLKPINKGLDWLDKNFVNSLNAETKWPGYYLYNIKRVGMASGCKYFGAVDWYKLGAAKCIATQNPNGSWSNANGNDDIIETAYHLLFLVEGREPVMFNKLQYDGDWNNRPRDLANACQAMLTDVLCCCGPIGWQIINLKAPVSEWHDAPILVINGSTAPKFTDEDLVKLRTYVMQGGMILSCAESSEMNSKTTVGTDFSKGMKAVYAKLWPDYEMVPVPPGHPLLSGQLGPAFKDRPHLNMITNGVRILAIHAADDLPLRWQLNRVKQDTWAFNFLRPLALWVTDSDPINYFRARGTTPWPDAKEFTPKATISIARVAVGSNFDPEPLAWARFSRFMGNLYQVKVDVLDPMPITKLAASGAKIAVVTGTNKVDLTADEKAALKAFVEGGGTIIIDVAGGKASSPACKAFGDSIESALADIFGANALQGLTLDSEPFNLPGLAIQKAFTRRATKLLANNKNELKMRGITIKDRVAVFYSPIDLTGGLVGYQCYGMDGYAPGRGTETDPGTAFLVMRNLVLYAAGVQTTPTTQPAIAPGGMPGN